MFEGGKSSGEDLPLVLFLYIPEVQEITPEFKEITP